MAFFLLESIMCFCKRCIATTLGSEFRSGKEPTKSASSKTFFKSERASKCSWTENTLTTDFVTALSLETYPREFFEKRTFIPCFLLMII